MGVPIDYYGCPLDITLDGVDYTLNTRLWNWTDPERDSSTWYCHVTDEYSTYFEIKIYGDVDQIYINGDLLYSATFLPPEQFPDPSVLEMYPKNN